MLSVRPKKPSPPARHASTRGGEGQKRAKDAVICQQQFPRGAEALQGHGRRIPPGAKIPPDIGAADAKHRIGGDGIPIRRGRVGVGDEDRGKASLSPKPDLTAHHWRDTAIWRPMEIECKGVAWRGLTISNFEDFGPFWREKIKESG